ncbi:hypothetical protein GCM10027416_08220 [Okibacterium endophyticum]
MAEQPPALSLGRYAAIVRRQWKVIVASTVLGALIAVVSLLLVGQSYTARTDVNINVISTDPFNAQRSASGLLDGTTEAQIASSHVVAATVADELGLSAAELRSSLEATVIPDATVIRISMTAPSAREARAGADAIAEAYLAYRSEQAEQRLSGILSRIAERLDDLQEQLVDANSRVSAAVPGSSEANQATSDRDLILIELDSLLAQKTTTESIDTSGGSILTSAGENEVATAPSRTIFLATGVLAGLAVGLLLAFAINAFRHRVRDAGDVARATGIRVLAQIPPEDGSVPATGSVLDAIRVARERILSVSEAAGRVFAVIDDTDGHNVSLAAVNLAASFAEAGQPTRLVVPGASAELETRVSSAVAALEHLEFIAVADSQAAPDAGRHVMTDELRGLLDADGGRSHDALTVLVLPKDSDRSSRVAAARLSDALVLIAELDRSEAGRLETEIDDLLEVGGVFLGALVVHRSAAETPSARPSVTHESPETSAPPRPEKPRKPTATSPKPAPPTKNPR